MKLLVLLTSSLWHVWTKHFLVRTGDTNHGGTTRPMLRQYSEIDGPSGKDYFQYSIEDYSAEPRRWLGGHRLASMRTATIGQSGEDHLDSSENKNTCEGSCLHLCNFVK